MQAYKLEQVARLRGQWAQDRQHHAKMPELKACAVAVQALAPGVAPQAQAGAEVYSHASL